MTPPSSDPSSFNAKKSKFGKHGPSFVASNGSFHFSGACASYRIDNNSLENPQIRKH